MEFVTLDHLLYITRSPIRLRREDTVTISSDVSTSGPLVFYVESFTVEPQLAGDYLAMF